MLHHNSTEKNDRLSFVVVAVVPYVVTAKSHISAVIQRMKLILSSIKTPS